MGHDLILVHAPSVYDFRDRDDILFAYLSNSDSVHVSPVFEMPPVGMIAIQQHLSRCGFSVEFYNVASQMLRHPEFDVDEFFKKVPADYIGIDLHWLAHAQGTLELAKRYKEIHPQAKTVLGGISSTFFHEELLSYPQVDYVIRGYDTLFPFEMLLKSENAVDRLKKIPNLTFRHNGSVQTNELTHAPDTYSACVDWQPVFSKGSSVTTPYNIAIPQAGCEYSCKWCGGGSYFYKNHMGRIGVSQKTPRMLSAELDTLTASNTLAHTVTMIDFWHEYDPLFKAAMKPFSHEKIASVHYSLHRLPEIQKAKEMARGVKAVIELSPDSSNLEVARKGGRGLYDMVQMERFMDALMDDIYIFEIYFMIGLPGQNAAHIREDVAYCEHLLKKYQGKRVIPYICPMLPFLDPGSEIFDQPEKFGYRLFHKTFEEHRNAMTRMSWKDRLNYETEGLNREELVAISYEAVRKLTVLKNRYGMLPSGISESIVDLIDRTVTILSEIDVYQKTPGHQKTKEMARFFAEKISHYNREIFRSVRSQQRPVDFGFARAQWFDTDEAFKQVFL